jgi:hypothetical protein
MKKLPKILLFLTFAVFLLALSETSVYAVPKLGVATEFAYVGGDDQTGLERYQDYFVDTYIQGTDEYHGFAIGGSGSSLIVFTRIKDAEIFLLTTADVYDEHSPTLSLNGEELLLDDAIFDDEKFSSYGPSPYYGISLGSVPDDDDESDGTNGWVLLEDFPSKKDYWGYELVLNFDGSFEDPAYFFAVAEKDNPGWIVTPKTASAVFPVPEPATMLLVGAGLIGLAAVGRRKFLKRL